MQRVVVLECLSAPLKGTGHKCTIHIFKKTLKCQQPQSPVPWKNQFCSISLLCCFKKISTDPGQNECWQYHYWQLQVTHGHEIHHSFSMLESNRIPHISNLVLGEKRIKEVEGNALGWRWLGCWRDEEVLLRGIRYRFVSLNAGLTGNVGEAYPKKWCIRWAGQKVDSPTTT